MGLISSPGTDRPAVTAGVGVRSDGITFPSRSSFAWLMPPDDEEKYDDPDEEGQVFIQGLEAYQHALEDNYFQLVVLDGSTGIGRQLQPEEFGFARTDTVTDPTTGHTWQLYQRFDEIQP